MVGYMDNQMSRKTIIFGLKLWVVVGIAVGGSIIIILLLLSIWWLVSKRRNKMEFKLGVHTIPSVSKEIQEVNVRNGSNPKPMTTYDDPEKVLVVVEENISEKQQNQPLEGSFMHLHKKLQRVAESKTKVERVNSTEKHKEHNHDNKTVEEVSNLGWGNWYTLRELDIATGAFAECNVLGEGGYGIVYRGKLPDGTPVAVKNLLNNRGQAEKEFRVEVEAIGRVRHKNLVRLLGYCIEGSHRLLVYEYVDNGNLDQWLHGPISRTKSLTWEARMKIILGTAKALAYLHEALEPKVVHRDVKSSNILIDSTYNAKISDFGLAKLLGAGKSHVTTRVMGTFGYVAPEYANTGLLNERSDVYSFGVLLMEVITGRDPVDYSRPSSEVNLVDWLKMMVGQRRSEEVGDPNLNPRPVSRALKRALLVALRCVDPDSSKRPKMGHVVHMLEADDYLYKDDKRQLQRAATEEEANNRNNVKRWNRSRYEG